MSLFDQMKDLVSSQLLGGENQKLLDGVMGLFNQSGGLAGLMKTFQDKGLGDVIGSWVSTGQNLPISPQQLQSVLGNEQLQGIASKLGISLDDVANGFSNLLPQVVDKLTPDGQVPDNNLLEQGLAFLKNQSSGNS
jgi:uncharacterized protein YidB (DUF937 family)